MSRDVWGTYISPAEYEEAAKHGISKKAIYTRIGRGMKAKDALTKPIKGRKNDDYMAALSIAVANGINPDTFRLRIQARGWTLEQAANTPTMTHDECAKLGGTSEKRKRVIPAEIVELAAQNGICYATLYDRVRRGMCLTEAATEPLMKVRNHPWARNLYGSARY